MQRRFVAYAVVFAVSVAAGYLVARPAAAATSVSVSFHAEPAHYGHRPPVRYYGPVPRFYPPGYFSPKYYYGPRGPSLKWKRDRWDNWNRWDRRNWHRHDRRHKFHHKHDRRDRHRRDKDRHDRHWRR